MPRRRQRQSLIAVLALAFACLAQASPASDEKLRLVMQRGAPVTPGRLAEREGLLRQGEAALAGGNAAAAEQAFDRAAMILHSADTEMGLVRSYMQSGQYRRALAFGAHTAGAHLDAVGGAALYAWLLHAGGQDVLAHKLLADAQARAPSQPLVAQVGRELASAAPRAHGDMLLPPARLAPYGGSALPQGARVVAAGTLVGEGGMAFVPAQAAKGRLWVRNGWGQQAMASVVATSGGVALLRLERPLAPPAIGVAPNDAFPGSVAFAVAYPPSADAGPAWPLLRTGFLGGDAGGKGDRLLDAAMRRGLAPGGPVFDQAGRLAGVALGNKMLAAPRLRDTFAARVKLPVVKDNAKLGPDAVYEAALRSTLQVIAIR